MKQPIRSIAIAAFGALALFVTGCQTGPVGAVTPGASEAEAPMVRRPVGEYRLGSGDRLRVTVFNEDDLSGEYQVTGSGSISMPLIGDIPAKGRTLSDLEDAVEAALRNGYLRSPQVSAEVLNFRPYYILGEVKNPAEYPYQEGLTVMNAIATAGGFSYRANKNVVVIKTADGNQEQRIELRPDTPVLPGDTIRVLERFF
jgi:protein involved in polysaccharide export with SLBB domain